MTAPSSSRFELASRLRNPCMAIWASERVRLLWMDFGRLRVGSFYAREILRNRLTSSFVHMMENHSMKEFCWCDLAALWTLLCLYRFSLRGGTENVPRKSCTSMECSFHSANTNPCSSVSSKRPWLRLVRQKYPRNEHSHPRRCLQWTSGYCRNCWICPLRSVFHFPWSAQVCRQRIACMIWWFRIRLSLVGSSFRALSWWY